MIIFYHTLFWVLGITIWMIAAKLLYPLFRKIALWTVGDINERTEDQFKPREKKFVRYFSYGFASVVAALSFPIFTCWSYDLVWAHIGVKSDYNVGSINAYYSDLWVEEGAFYTTYEGRIYESVEADEHDRVKSIMSSFRIATHDKTIYEKLKKNVGKRVLIKYSNWYVKPYWAGRADNIVTDVISLED